VKKTEKPQTMKKVEKKIQTKEFQEDVAGCLGRTQGHIR
jgi:hypothetical protein